MDLGKELRVIEAEDLDLDPVIIPTPTADADAEKTSIEPAPSE